MTTPITVSDQELVPPPDPNWVLRLSGLGVILCGVSATIGAVLMFANLEVPWIVSTLRLLLVGVGCLVAGSAVSLLPRLSRHWLLAAVAFALSAYAGLPEHWDSARTLAKVLAAVALAGAALSAMPVSYRCLFGSAAILFHFGGILTATTSPEPGPWLSDQAYNRVYWDYLTFTYMRNAYHFYSPEPGPASLLYVLVKYDTTDPDTQKSTTVHEWLELPRRDLHMKDPLGLCYYRRLSLTEMTAQTITSVNSPLTPEKVEAANLRRSASFGLLGKDRIPFAPEDYMPATAQYRVPYSNITRYVVPSYARHLAYELSAPGRTVVSMKIYRLEHRVLPTQSFARGDQPFDPVTYLPFFYGEYDASGNLMDAQDPMLYWLVPILPKVGGPSVTDDMPKNFDDYLSIHAGYQVEWRRR